MSDEAANVRTLKDAYKIWIDSKGERFDQWIAIIADKFKFGSLAEGRHGASYLTSYDSRDALEHYFAGIKVDWAMVAFEAEHFVAQGDRVVMLGRCCWRHKRTGKVVDSPKTDSWRFAGGKVVEFYEYYDTAQLRDAMA